ncbi:2-dehydropantoate 2-reductase [Arenibaculum sp.]|uniref:ketopantoate reductase family protein n=1 Tax=Arenibaculum sp. TaxID=2865862 RepID=UPI002E11D0FF|nr:2-dehydropantoate 2-reductase [Arenibaculum sp.]
MRIVIMGSGGIGGYFGAKLARAGHDVVFVARGEHLRAIRENGLRVSSEVDGDWTVDAPAVATLDGQPPADLVLFCVKSFDTEDAAELVRPVLGPGTGVLSLQNGVDNEDKLARILGAGRAVGGIAYAFVHIAAPGVIAHQQLARIVCGEFGGTAPGRLPAFAEAGAAAGIRVDVVPDIRRSLWEKYVFLTAFAGATALTRMPAQAVREVPELRRLWQRQIDELLALARAEAAGLDEGVAERCAAFLGSVAPISYTSLYHDLMQGRRLELETLHGHAVRLGERHAIPTPTLSAVYAGLLPYRDGPPKVT